MKNLIPIVHVVMDGAPCATKTETQEKLRIKAEKWDNVHAIFVEESARKYFKIHGQDQEMWVKQKGIFQMQLDLEKPAREEALDMQSQGKRVLVCYDRSLKTSEAYMPIYEWSRLLSRFEMTNEIIASQYTHPIHLVTVAVDKPHLYKNDPDRPETKERALELNSLLWAIWRGYFTNVPSFNNMGSMEDKIQRVSNYVKNKLDEQLLKI